MKIHQAIADKQAQLEKLQYLIDSSTIGATRDRGNRGTTKRAITMSSDHVIALPKRKEPTPPPTITVIDDDKKEDAAITVHVVDDDKKEDADKKGGGCRRAQGCRRRARGGGSG